MRKAYHLVILMMLSFCCQITRANGEETAVVYPADESCARLNGEDVPRKGFFKGLDVAVTAGTTGIGIDVASKLNDVLQLRLGYSVMPHVEVPMTFKLGIMNDKVKDPDELDHKIDEKFSQINELFRDLTGYEIKREVEMAGWATYHNFKFMVDVFPFHDKHWHFTAGFYWGNSQVGYAQNSPKSSTSLVGVGMYNALYNKLKDIDFAALVNSAMPELNGQIPVVEYEGDLYEKMIASRNSMIDWWNGDVDVALSWGTLNGETMTIPDHYTDEQVRQYADKIKLLQTVGQLQRRFDQMKNYGTIGAYIGDYKDGSGRYVMLPDGDAMVKVRAFANNFKPYLGFGYGGALDKQKRISLSFDCGAMFWGGSPDIVVHDGTSLKYDVKNLRGNVGTYVDLAGKLTVFPVLDVRLAYRIF